MNINRYEILILTSKIYLYKKKIYNVKGSEIIRGIISFIKKTKIFVSYFFLSVPTIKEKD